MINLIKISTFILKFVCCKLAYAIITFCSWPTTPFPNHRNPWGLLLLVQQTHPRCVWRLRGCSGWYLPPLSKAWLSCLRGFRCVKGWRACWWTIYNWVSEWSPQSRSWARYDGPYEPFSSGCRCLYQSHLNISNEFLSLAICSENIWCSCGQLYWSLIKPLGLLQPEARF